MKFCLTQGYKQDFENAWDDLTAKKITNNKHIKKYEPPQDPGPGFLSAMACKLSICSATGKWEGESVCCGKELAGAYYCETCQSIYDRQNHIEHKKSVVVPLKDDPPF